MTAAAETRAPKDARFPELRRKETAAVIESIREGLPACRFEELKELLDVSTGELLRLADLSASTLSRRRTSGRFDKNESERLLRIGRLFSKAAEVFEDEALAREWLKAPQRALGGARPLCYADTGPGAREVDRVLTRIAHGVFT